MKKGDGKMYIAFDSGLQSSGLPLAKHGKIAKRVFEREGSFAPMLIVDTDEGAVLAVLRGGLPDDRREMMFVLGKKFAEKVPGIKRVIFITEAWVKTLSKDDPMPNKPIRYYADKEEALILSSLDIEGNSKMLSMMITETFEMTDKKDKDLVPPVRRLGKPIVNKGKLELPLMKRFWDGYCS